jgi:hypothetical protein
MDTFKVLPTDPRFLAMTQEQIILLVSMYNEAQREQARALKRARAKQGGSYGGEVTESYYDPDFDKYLEEVTKEKKTRSDNEWLTL